MLRARITIRCADPTVRTRKHEVVSCCVAVSNKPKPLKPAFPKKRSAYVTRQNYFRLALNANELIRKARRAETTAHLSEWLNSPGLQPPK